MQFPFVLDSVRGEVPVNWYPVADSEKGVILEATPGLLEFAQLSSGAINCTEVRALHKVHEYLYAVATRAGGQMGSAVFKINTAGTETEIGGITSSSGRMTIITNGTQVMFVDSNTAYVYTIASGTFSQISDADFPGSIDATFLDGYGIFIRPDTGEFWLTASYDFNSINALDWATAEGSPDKLLGIIADHRELWLGGPDSIEVWLNTGGTFPFERASGGFLEVGMAAGRSFAKGDNSVFWLSDKLQMIRADGYRPAIISTRKFDREVQGYGTVSDAFGFYYTWEGQGFYQLTFPTEQKTWVYDAATGALHKRSSYRTGEASPGRHRANCYCYYDRKHLVGDYANGKIYQLDGDTYSDDGEEIHRLLYSQEVRGQHGERVFYAGYEAVFDCGKVYLSRTPAVMLSWSNDGGNTWSNEMTASAGNVGEYLKRARFYRLGSGYQRIFKLRVSDPIKWRLLSVNRV